MRQQRLYAGRRRGQGASKTFIVSVAVQGDSIYGVKNAHSQRRQVVSRSGGCWLHTAGSTEARQPPQHNLDIQHVRKHGQQRVT
jgi:hypothetical protein